MAERRLVSDICFDEATLLLGSWVFAGVATMWRYRVMVVVRPFRKVIRKLKSRRIGSRILEINYDELLVFVGGLQKRRLLIIWPDPQNIAILSLEHSN